MRQNRHTPYRRGPPTQLHCPTHGSIHCAFTSLRGHFRSPPLRHSWILMFDVLHNHGPHATHMSASRLTIRQNICTFPSIRRGHNSGCRRFPRVCHRLLRRLGSRFSCHEEVHQADSRDHQTSFPTHDTGIRVVDRPANSQPNSRCPCLGITCLISPSHCCGGEMVERPTSKYDQKWSGYLE